MYDLFAPHMRRNIGSQQPPELRYLERTYQREIRDVQQYYRRYPKRMNSANVLANVLFHLPARDDMDDRRYVRYIEDTAPGVTRAFGFVSSVYKGRVQSGGVTLGPETDEVVVASQEDFAFDRPEKQWWYWMPYRFLYHTRHDPNLPILNNTTPGKGFGVGVLNVPMLALQYRYWRRYQKELQGTEDDVYRFIGACVLPNLLPSYFEIAYFNRLDLLSKGLKTRNYPTPHPFYLTDYSRQLNQMAEKTLDTYMRRGQDLEQLAGVVPMVLSDSLLSLMQLPKDPVTRQNEWAFLLALLPYVDFLVHYAIRHGHIEGYFMNEVHKTLRDALRDRSFTGVGGSKMIAKWRGQLQQLIVDIEDAQHAAT